MTRPGQQLNDKGTETSRETGNHMKDRIYICHTYYHVYITFLKELNLPSGKRGQATLVLSGYSIDFEKLKERVESTGLFEEVYEFNEQGELAFPELARWRVDTGNLVRNLLNRIRFTRSFARLQEPYVPVDLRQYGDIYVFCDSDPIGYYLNQRRIPYHALEDGLDCLKNYDAARYDNRGHFKLKAFLSLKWNLIFIQNGYGKYCIDMEVNDLSLLKYPFYKYVEQNRQELVDQLSQEDRELILKAFVRDMESLKAQLSREDGQDKILILTDPLCTLDIREKIFRDIIHQFKSEGAIFLKPHPRDVLDYRRLFPEYPQFDATVPMEMLNFFPGIHFRKVVAALTEVKAVRFADEVVRLGEDFMDKYEDPLVHRQNEQI